MKFRVIGYNIYDIEISDDKLNYETLYKTFYNLANIIEYQSYLFDERRPVDFIYNFLNEKGNPQEGYVEDNWVLSEFQQLQKGVFSNNWSLRNSCCDNKLNITDPLVNRDILRRIEEKERQNNTINHVFVDDRADYIVLYLIPYRNYIDENGKRYHSNPFGAEPCKRKFRPDFVY